MAAHQKILIADDDPEDIEILKEVFGQLDNSKSVEAVNDGANVINYLSHVNDADLPCLIVMDYKMPLMNAAEVLEAFSHEPRYAHIPKMVWSTSRKEEDMRRCITAGAKRYFVKPVSIGGLQTMAREMLDLCGE